MQVERISGVAILRLSGRFGAVVSEDLQQRIRAEFRPGGDIVLDFQAVSELSQQALRRLLLLARYARSIGCRLTIEGVPHEFRGMVQAAGLLPLFMRLKTDENVPVFKKKVYVKPDTYPTRTIEGYAVRRGDALPFGPSLTPRGVNFSLFSRHAQSVTLLLYPSGGTTPMAELLFPPHFRMGDVWAMTVFDLDIDDMEYAFRVSGPNAPSEGHRFNSRMSLLDPMAQCITGAEVFGSLLPGTNERTFRGRVVPHEFDWGGDIAPGIPVEELVIYELHVRGFTQSPTSQVQFPGTFAGLREKIPYLKKLGINCVELMPIFEFDELENPRNNPETGERLLNYWGYSTVAFCAPKASFAATGSLGMQSDELKLLVMDLHRNGIEVILDVVFNHTAERDSTGPTISFRGLDNRVYYMLAPDGEYLNFSGCGNTVNCNHPVVREFVRNCLRHWVTEYHIDGFRFDLASILGRDSSGRPLPNPPLLESLARDPVLSHTKLIAEAWDAGGLYQVGTFPSFDRWMEWNGKFRDTSRRFLRGDPGQTGEMAQRLIGSPDLYSERGPTASVNFVTCHDGFTLADLVSYNEKHNTANGEDNQDGSNENESWNCGVEGPTSDPAIQALRLKQSKNALALLFLSQGVPMLYMGDEVGRTQYGNNNPYCHDGPINWLDWSLRSTNSSLLRFCREIIAFRRRHPALRHDVHAGHRRSFEGNLLDVTWHGVEPFEPDWSTDSRSLALMLRLYSVHGLVDVLYIIFNMYWEPLEFRLPAAPEGWKWQRQIDTAAASPADIVTSTEVAPFLTQPKIRVDSRSTVVLVAIPPRRHEGEEEPV